MDVDVSDNNNVPSQQDAFILEEIRAKSASSTSANCSQTSSTMPVFAMNTNSNSVHRATRTLLSSPPPTPFMPSTTFKKTGFWNGCWKQKDITKREKVLSVSLLLSVFLVILLVICFAVVVFHPQYFHWFTSSLPWESKCLTPVCVSAAADILKRMDKKVDPCVDFYKFSCGGLDNKLNPIPDDKSSISTAMSLQLDIDKRIRGTSLHSTSFEITLFDTNKSRSIGVYLCHVVL